ncbi:DUF2071 domain-containing protein [Catenulispora sp. NF23]|uniref:DUF2071 domain-containing protein n=1 Tax=Catenulispora pinistramenti TaxID=2705254 RepID=A0ABS5KZB9_9ACTN|nr:DUF2071 domain-containing protein [Catenulispora pinistramenti]MBS2534963.1 DUF2071 domain-containing protein [Catenulispora pinistramenti]MBS2551421.1 DUF2071 domain-containing protein [Catenulispora pinistramenti]
MTAPGAVPVSEPEPVTPDPPPLPGRPLMTQSWLDATFLHWALDPEAVAPLLPAGVLPDIIDGVTYVGLIAFRMHRIGWWPLPGMPYLGTFPETNVRLYSVDSAGRRGVVFRSLEASRMLPVATARSAFRLPYRWARMSAYNHDDMYWYASRRREPGLPPAKSLIGVRVGAAVEEPNAVDHFLTARWRLHFTLGGRTVHMPNAHPRWPLHHAELLACEEDLVAAAGLPGVAARPPDSVLFSPGVPVRFGSPRAVSRGGRG